MAAVACGSSVIGLSPPYLYTRSCMKLLIVRHAKAEDRETFAATGADDAERPLTGAGREQVRQAARTLKDLVPRIDVLATSPLTRARETARLLAREYKRLKPVEMPELSPGLSEKAVVAWLAEQPADAVVALVGHEPDLSVFASWLLTGRKHPILALKKGAACLLEFEAKPDPGGAVLAWSLTPVQLRRLRR